MSPYKNIEVKAYCILLMSTTFKKNLRVVCGNLRRLKTYPYVTKSLVFIKFVYN